MDMSRRNIDHDYVFPFNFFDSGDVCYIIPTGILR